jgi:hypothetical protein
MIKLQVPNDPRLLRLAGEFLIRASSGAASFDQMTAHNQAAPDVAFIDEALAFEEQTTPAAAIEQVITASGPLDSAGYPWDVRIHTKAKSKLGDGTYRLSPGVDKELVAKVRAEYDANRSATAEQTPPPPPADQPRTMPQGLGEPLAAQVPPPPPAEQTPPPPPAAAAASNPVALFQDTMRLYASATTSKIITADWAADWCKQQGLTGLPGLMANPAVCGQFADLLRSMGAQ